MSNAKTPTKVLKVGLNRLHKGWTKMKWSQKNKWSPGQDQKRPIYKARSFFARITAHIMRPLPKGRPMKDRLKKFYKDHEDTILIVTFASTTLAMTYLFLVQTKNLKDNKVVMAYELMDSEDKTLGIVLEHLDGHTSDFMQPLTEQ